MNSRWYEVWGDDGAMLPYILVVMPRESQGGGGVHVLDPREGNRAIYEADDYEAAKLWLLEDEYQRIGERVLR